MGPAETWRTHAASLGDRIYSSIVCCTSYAVSSGTASSSARCRKAQPGRKHRTYSHELAALKEDIRSIPEDDPRYRRCSIAPGSRHPSASVAALISETRRAGSIWRSVTPGKPGRPSFEMSHDERPASTWPRPVCISLPKTTLSYRTQQ